MFVALMQQNYVARNRFRCRHKAWHAGVRLVGTKTQVEFVNRAVGLLGPLSK